VKNLVLPAAEEVGSIWKNKFGFGAITQDEVCVCLCGAYTVLSRARGRS
jgi:hypothetical protein